VWVTHDREEALSIGDKVGVLNKGNMAQCDTPEVCFDTPKNRFVASFLGEANYIPADVDGQTFRSEFGDGDLLNTVNKGVASLLVRPEQFILSMDHEETNATCLASVYEGAYRLVRVKADNGELYKVRCPRAVNPAVGVRVLLRLQKNECFYPIMDASS